MQKTTKRCPKCGATSFEVTAHVTQNWHVGPNGEFIECLANHVETMHVPNDEDIWGCAGCNFSAAGSKFNIEVHEHNLHPKQQKTEVQ
jgi:ribosomal protein L37AE/L43A